MGGETGRRSGGGLDDRPSAELRALIDAPSAIWVNVLDGAVWLALIYVMVAKPFT